MTDPDRDNDASIIASWHVNAAPWTGAVRAQRIESRRLITDRAILEAILDRAPGQVLDIGCGEGWLARALSRHGIAVLGVDAVPELIEQARAAGGGEFIVASYEQIARGALRMQLLAPWQGLGRGAAARRAGTVERGRDAGHPDAASAGRMRGSALP